MSQLCISGGQSIGASASASFLEGAFLCMCVYMLCMCSQEGHLTLRMRNMWPGSFAYPPPFFGLLWCCGWEAAWQCRICERCELDTWVGRSPGGGHGNPLQYSCLENHMNKAWWTTFWSWTVLWRHTRSSKVNTEKKYLFHYRGLECKIGNQEIPRVIGKFGLGVQNETGQRLIELCQENVLVIANTLFPQQKRRLYPLTSPDDQHQNQIDYILCSIRWRSSIQSERTSVGADCCSDHELLIAKFRLKLKKVGKATRPFRYDLNQIPYDYTVEVRSRFKGLDL